MRRSYGAQQRHMTVPRTLSRLPSARPPLGHGCSTTPAARSLVLALATARTATARAASRLPCTLPRLTRPACTFSSSHIKTRTRDASPQSRPPALFPRLLQPLFLWPAPPPISTTAGLHSLLPQPLFSNRPSSNLHPGFSRSSNFSSNSPHRISTPGLNPLPLNHFFSNTIATDRLPLLDGPFAAARNKEAAVMAWMRMMGAESVNYHRETVIGRVDDHPGAALDYYASRGETPLVWGGSGARDLGLAGAVSEAQYDAIFGPGGARDPPMGRAWCTPNGPGWSSWWPPTSRSRCSVWSGRAEDMHCHFGHRDRGHVGLPGRLDDRPRRAPGALPDPRPDQWFALGAHPPRHLPGR